MKSWKVWAAVAALAAAGMPGAQAASIVCGDPALGLRVTTVDPALACTYAGLTNLGDPALETLVSGFTSPDAAVLLDRDTANSNGGVLSITGVGGLSGSWTINSSVWDYGRVFLYFHFGDGPDNPGPGSTTDPDTFLIELARANTTGSWLFSGQNGLSNIGLLGSGRAPPPPPPPSDAPEPGTLALLGLGLLGLAGARRRKF